MPEPTEKATGTSAPQSKATAPPTPAAPATPTKMTWEAALELLQGVHDSIGKEDFCFVVVRTLLSRGAIMYLPKNDGEGIYGKFKLGATSTADLKNPRFVHQILEKGQALQLPSEYGIPMDIVFDIALMSLTKTAAWEAREKERFEQLVERAEKASSTATALQQKLADKRAATSKKD